MSGEERSAFPEGRKAADWYTPATEHVRLAYITFDKSIEAEELLEDEFDRWLARIASEAAERGWDEGVCETWTVEHDENRSEVLARNPYRADRLSAEREERS